MVTGRIIPNPVDPFGMADWGFARTPRGLAETEPAPIKRRPSQLEAVSACFPEYRTGREEGIVGEAMF